MFLARTISEQQSRDRHSSVFPLEHRERYIINQSRFVRSISKEGTTGTKGRQACGKRMTRGEKTSLGCDKPKPCCVVRNNARQDNKRARLHVYTHTGESQRDLRTWLFKWRTSFARNHLVSPRYAESACFV